MTYPLSRRNAQYCQLPFLFFWECMYGNLVSVPDSSCYTQETIGLFGVDDDV